MPVMRRSMGPALASVGMAAGMVQAWVPVKKPNRAMRSLPKLTSRQGVPRTGSGLPEQLVVRARSLKDRQSFALSPDDQPVAGVGHVALPAARPASFEVVHAVPSA